MNRERRRDLATTTVGAAGTAGGGLLRHEAVQEVIAARGGKKDPRIHGLAVMRSKSKPIRNKYLAGAGLGLISAPPLAIGATRLVRRDAVEKREKVKDSFLAEGLRGATDSLALKGKSSLDHETPTKARAAALGSSIGIGTAAGYGAKYALRAHSPKVKAIASPVAGVLGAAAGTPLSSKIVNRVSPGYEVTPSGVRRKKTAAKRPSSQARVLDSRNGGDRMAFRMGTVPSDERFSKIALRLVHHGTDSAALKGIRSKGWEARNLGERGGVSRDSRGPGVYVGTHRVASGFARQYSGKSKKDGRVMRLAVAGPVKGLGEIKSPGMTDGITGEVITWRKRTASMDNAVGGLVQPKQIIQAHRVRKADQLGDRAYRARVTAAGALPIPVIQHVQTARAAAKFGDPNYRKQNARTTFATAQGGEIAGAAAGAYGASALANRNGGNNGFNRRATQASDKIDSGKAAVRTAVRNNVPGAARVMDTTDAAKTKLKPAGGNNTRTAKIIQRATKPLKTNPKAAAVGALAGQMVVGTAATQYGISRNIKRSRSGKVAKIDAAPGYTRREQEQQLRRKRRNAALTTLNATVGTAGVSAFGASRVKSLAPKKAALETTALGLGAVGGGLGALSGYQSASIARRDIRAQKKALAVSKSMPDMSALHIPTGMAKPAGALKTKTYHASGLRRLANGGVTRIKPGVR